jgi:hypothetical protein
LYAYIPTGKPDLHLKIPLNEGARKKHAQVWGKSCVSSFYVKASTNDRLTC